MNKLINTLSNCLLAASAIAFLLLYIILSYNDRLASDDIVFLAISKNQNLFQYIRSFYGTWSGRWTSGSYFYLISSVAKTFKNNQNYIFLYYFLTNFIFVYSVNTINRFCLSKFLNILIDTKTSLLYSVLFIACFYYFTFQTSEVWWWVCASVDTLQGIVFLLFGIALLMKENKKLYHYILICLSFVYVGGCFEIYTLVIESMCFILLIYFIFINPVKFSVFRNSVFSKGVLIATTCLFLSSLICFVAPGNRNRRNAESKNNAITATVHKQETLADTGKNLFTQKKYIVALGLSSLWILLGMKFKNNTITAEQKKRILKLLAISIIPLLISIFITWSFQTLVLRNYSIPERAWTFSSFSISIFCCFLFFVIGFLLNIELFALTYFIKIVIPLLITLLLSINFIKQYAYTTNYAKAYDQLIIALIDSKSDDTMRTIDVRKLPESGMLIPLDIADDYIKVPLKEILNFNCEINVAE
ncbi:MAG: hypothetical protein ACXVNN_05585 [Bacteroidia bacterium]